MLRALVLGARGQLGRDLTEILATDYEVSALGRAECDLLDTAAVRRVVAQARADVVFNCGAHTKVDLQEREPELALALNQTAVEAIASAVGESGGKLVHFSTDYVFDGRALRPYVEEDPTHPRSVYGRTKLAGESAALALGGSALVIRTSWLYGPGERNFVHAIASRAARGERLTVVDDQRGAPTHTLDVAGAVTTLLKRECHGLYHVTNAGDATWFDFAKAIVELCGFTAEVAPCATDTSKYPAPRPAYSVLSNDKLWRDAGLRLRPWRDALAAYLRRGPWGTLDRQPG